MTHIQNLLAQPARWALGWALLHFLWRNAGGPGPGRLQLPDGLLALPVVTFTASLVHALGPPPHSPVWIPAAAPLVTAPAAPALPRLSLHDSLTPFLPWIVALWIAGVLLLSMRWIGAWACLHRLRRAASLPVPPDWERALRDLMRRAAVSIPVRLSIHRLTQSPCVIGWLRPVILMPAALAGLDWRALEALLAHELAYERAA